MAASTASSRASPAVHALTQPTLFALVVAFQDGVPGVVVSVLRRYRADGHVQFTTGKGGRRQFSTQLLQNVSLVDEWAKHTVPEAIAYYDDMKALQTLWRLYIRRTATNPGMSAEQLWQNSVTKLADRVCDAAAAFGKLGMLQWLYHTQRDTQISMSRTSLNVRQSAIFGQLHVLEWLMNEFPVHVNGLLHEMNCVEVVRRSQWAVLLLLFQRQLGFFPLETMVVAVETGDLQVVQLLFDYLPPACFIEPLLIGHAALCDHLEIVQWLVETRKSFYTMELIGRVLQQGHVDVARFLLAYRHEVVPPVEEGTLDPMVLYELVKGNKLKAIEFLVSIAENEDEKECIGCLSVRPCAHTTHSLEAVKLLLPVSPRGHVVMTLVELTLSKKAVNKTVDYIVEHAVDVPPAVLGFVARYRSNTLGPLASLLRDACLQQGIGSLDKSDFQRWLGPASRDDLTDGVLLTASANADVLNGILTFDLHQVPPVRVSSELLESFSDAISIGWGQPAVSVSSIQSHIAWRKNMRQ